MKIVNNSKPTEVEISSLKPGDAFTSKLDHDIRVLVELDTNICSSKSGNFVALNLRTNVVSSFTSRGQYKVTRRTVEEIIIS
jgi:hypothetical protein